MKMTTHIKYFKTSLLIAAASIAAPTSASAALISVNLQSSQSTVSNPTYGLWTEAANTWNISGTSSSNLVDSSGVGTTTVGFSTSHGSLGGNGSFGPDELTNKGRYGANDSTTIGYHTISGLVDGQAYELLFYHAQNHTNEIEIANGVVTPELSLGAGDVISGGVAPEDFTGSTTTAGSTVYVDGFDTTNGAGSTFYYYSSITADSSGEIVITTDGGGYEIVTGFQIRTVPEPSSTALLGLGGLALLLRRRR
jgi:hypothetical protein